MGKAPRKKKTNRLGHYEIIEEIGRGGMAIVYKGIQSSLNRIVAIKVLPESFARDEEFIVRFDREAETVAQLSHPNIIQIIDRGQENKTCYFVMEYVDGLSLDRFLRERSLTFRQMLEIALQICRALSYAHSKEIVHRDLKPSNILIAGESLRVKVADFGLVQLAQTSGELSTLTQSNVAMGTIEYMAPEQRRDARNVDSRADIFSFGIILYEMFTGQLPVGHFKRPGEINPEIPRTLDEIILRCLKPMPDERYQTAGELAGDLDGIFRENPWTMDKIVHTVKRAGERASTAIRKRPRRFILGGAGAFSALIILLILRSCAGRPPGPPGTAPVHPPPPPGAGAGPAGLAPAHPPPPPGARAGPAAAAPAWPAPPKRLPPAAGAEADYKKAEAYAAADMKSANLREFAVMSTRYVVENYKDSDPGWAEKAQMKIGQIYEQADKLDLAVAEYGRLLKLFPSGALRADAQFKIAECLKPSGFFSGFDPNRKEKVDRASAEYRKVYQDYPSSPYAAPALFELALLQAGNKTADGFKAAIETFEKISRDYPESDKSPQAMVRIAKLSGDKKVQDNEKSIRVYEELLSRYPDREDEFHVLLNIAKVTQEKLKDGKGAIEAYRRVIREKPGTEDAMEANRRLEKLLKLNRSP